MFSPPVQPISSSTSGTGSVTTMWLDATASALRNPAKPAVALLTAEHRSPGADACRSAVTAVASRPSRRTGVRSWRRTPASIAFARRPSASRAGWTFAATRRSIPPRNAGEAHRADDLLARQRHRLLGSPGLAARLDDLVPVADLCLARRDLERAGGAVPGVDPFASHQAPIPCTARSDARHTSTARTVPTRSRRIGRSSHSVETKPPLRPLGPWPASAASSTTTFSPGSSVFSCSAVQSPRKPAPTMTTSALVSPSSGRVGSTGPASSSQ